MKPGLDTITAICSELGHPERRLGEVVHVAGTNGKGAVCAIIAAALRNDRTVKVARYTSPHLVRLNERFFLDGMPIADEVLERESRKVESVIESSKSADFSSVTFFEALTATAFAMFSGEKADWTVLETGLGGRLDATNVCNPRICVITRIGLDHCDWLGDTVEKIAAEKAGIIKPGVPIVLARNDPAVVEVVRKTAAEKGAPFFYAPDLASAADIPSDFPLAGAFNRENAVTALAAIRVLEKTLGSGFPISAKKVSLAQVVWPGRFQQVGNFIVDGAHNPPAARALVASLPPNGSFTLIAGFCGDKDVSDVLRILSPYVNRAYAVRTNNPRSLAADATKAKMDAAGMTAECCSSLDDAIRMAGGRPTLVCGSLFLAGEALVALGAYPWPARFDPAESIKAG